MDKLNYLEDELKKIKHKILELEITIKTMIFKNKNVDKYMDQLEEAYKYRDELINSLNVQKES